jgi:exonuclease SbcC
VLAAAPATRQDLDAALRRLEDAGRPLRDLEAAVVRAARHAAAGIHRDDLAGRRGDAEAARMQAAHAVQAARSRWLDLRERRLDGMAAELAAALEPGAPCPVCGSPEHPAPAAPAPTSTAAVDAVSEREAQETVKTAEAVLASADSHARELADEHAAARLAAGGDDPVETLTATLAARTAERDASAQATAALPEARAVLAQHHVSTDNQAATQRAVEQEVRALEVHDAALRTERDALHGRLEDARGDDEAVPDRVARLGAAADALAATVSALADQAHAVQALGRAEQRLTRAAVGAGFADAPAAAAALRPAERVTELSDAFADHDREEDLVAAGLAEPDLTGLALADAAETAAAVRAAVDALAVVGSARATAEGERGRLAAAHAKALQVHPELDGTVDRLGPVRAAYETADELARLAAGTGSDNRLRMRLSYYVLSARLEQVAEAASERLLRMSDGRFTLRHTDVRGSGNQRSGLGLEVCDGWYGTTRDPSTLSGGESFMASLALALGLADVVVAEAGGTLMDTLFVDEGFGGLDEQTLDAVLDVLDGLREGGRAVGLVSHVAELRDRIPVKLEVRKAQRGSSLALST